MGRSRKSKKGLAAGHIVTSGEAKRRPGSSSLFVFNPASVAVAAAATGSSAKQPAVPTKSDLALKHKWLHLDCSSQVAGQQRIDGPPPSVEDCLVFLIHTSHGGTVDDRRKAACFLRTLDAARSASELLKALGVFSVCVHDGMPRQQRKTLIRRYVEGSAPAVLLMPLANSSDADAVVKAILSVRTHQIGTRSVLVVPEDAESHLQQVDQMLAGVPAKTAERITTCSAASSGPSLPFPVSVRRRTQGLVAWGRELATAGSNAIQAQSRERLRSLHERAQSVLCAGLVGPRCGTSVAEMKKCMTVLGMAGDNFGFTLGERVAARTCWLDGKKGTDYGAPWEVERLGASTDEFSLQLRAEVEGGKWSQWKPNPDASDLDKWGGKYGKPAGHNEVAMFRCRPWAPLEVRNSAMCSRACPAPGNDNGYDGCLEFLRVCCSRGRRAMTIWDTAHFHFISDQGQHVAVSKRKMLLRVPLDLLSCLTLALRQWTIVSGGHHAPFDLLQGVWSCAFWSAKGAALKPLSAKLTATIMEFAVPSQLLGRAATATRRSRSREKGGASGNPEKKKRKKGHS
jgi:hypothetical protein